MVQYFKESEWGKNGDRVSSILKGAMEQIRGRAGARFFIHCAYSTSGHSQNSYHYRGLATDGHFEPKLSPLQELDAILAQPEVNGIGFYPGWSPRPGFHIDIREAPRVFWIEPVGARGKYVYYHDVPSLKKAICQIMNLDLE